MSSKNGEQRQGGGYRSIFKKLVIPGQVSSDSKGIGGKVPGG